MSTKSLVALFIVLIGAVVVSASVFKVHETERAILLQFGNLIDGDLAPGLHFKLPIAQEVKKFDARVLTLDSEPATY